MKENELIYFCETKFNKDFKTLNEQEVYYGLLEFVKLKLSEMPLNNGDRKVYYVSAEFLIGKLLTNNLINLGIYQEVSEILGKYDFNLNKIEELENEPSLGNGGLGRLAACFLDSIATLGLPGDGLGLNYHLGLFKQEIINNKQVENIDPWINQHNWLETTSQQYFVSVGKFYKQIKLTANLKEISIPGYQQSSINKLKLFDLATIDEAIVRDQINFDKTDILKNLTLFLYPDDSDLNGQLLRIFQQYFLVSASAQLIIDEYLEKYSNLHKISDHVVIQINDTHPSLIIPEMIRLLKNKGLNFNDAYEQVAKMVAYTNHTILAEALEKWPIKSLNKVCPQVVKIIKKIDKKINKQLHVGKNSSVSIIQNKIVHMAYLDIHVGFSINGVAALHTEILKNSELAKFYKIYPNKFNNKTNGVTFRRWLLAINPELVNLLDEKIGQDYHLDGLQLEKLLKHNEDSEVLEKLSIIKLNNKIKLAQYLKETQDLDLNCNSIFDIQIKRMHEYKRQQMNALYIIYKYLEIKKGNLPATPITIIFAAKAAPAYMVAKEFIHLINVLATLVNNDEIVNKHLKIVFVENYCVTKAEKLIPACDVSEQISLASKEASGTGNMKLMLNGAITLGTLDGANVEIKNLVGNDNIFIFGKDSNEIIKNYQNNSYVPKNFYDEDELIKTLVDFIIDPELLKIGDKETLENLHNYFLTNDYFMTLIDLIEYINTKEKVFDAYEDKNLWSQKMLVNIAKSGFFSSDRTIQQYNKDIWKL